MVASVLNTHCAVEVSVYVVRAFVRLRSVMAAHKALARKLAELEKRIEGHDDEITSELMERQGNPRNEWDSTIRHGWSEIATTSRCFPRHAPAVSL